MVLGGDGGAVDAGEVALSQVRVGEDQAAKVHRRLQGEGLCAAGVCSAFLFILIVRNATFFSLLAF